MTSTRAPSPRMRVAILADAPGEAALVRDRMSHAIDNLEALEISTIGHALHQIAPDAVNAIVVGFTWLAGAHDLRDLALLAEARLAPVLLLTEQTDLQLARRALGLGIEDVVDWDAFVGPRVRTTIELCAERQHLHQEGHRAHQRAANLHATCTGLTVVGSELEVAAATLDGVALFGAVASTILMRESDQLVLLHARDRASQTVNRFTRVAIAARDNPASEAARTLRPVWLDTHADLVASYGTDHGLEPAGTRCALPLVSGADLIGILGIAFAIHHRIDPDDRIALESLAVVCAQSIQRARVYEEMRDRVASEQRLLGIVADDLRGPLGVIASAVAEELETDVDDNQAKSLQRTQRAVVHAVRMVNELVDYSASNLGILALSPTRQDLFAELAACVEDARARTPTRRFVLSCTGDGVGRFDRVRMVQAVSNLLANAVQYGDPAQPITIRAEPTAERLYVEVNNRGPVIAGPAMAVLFEPMKRVDSAGREHLGLGLYLTKRIAEAHLGRVWVRSEAGSGTTFVLEVPRAGPPAPRQRAARTTAQGTMRVPSDRLPIVIPPVYQKLLARMTDGGLHIVLLRWLGLGGDQYPPHPRRMTDPVLVPFLPDIVLVAVEPGNSPREPVFRHIDVGGALERRLGHGLLGKQIQNPASGDYDIDMRAAYLRCYLQRSPMYDYLRFRRMGEAALFERLIVPCSRNGGTTITDLYAVARFCDLPDEPKESSS